MFAFVSIFYVESSEFFNNLIQICFFFVSCLISRIQKVVLPRLKSWIRRVAAEDDTSNKEENSSKSLAEETAEAAKAAASAAAIVATASQELLNSKHEGSLVNQMEFSIYKSCQLSLFYYIELLYNTAAKLFLRPKIF